MLVQVGVEASSKSGYEDAGAAVQRKMIILRRLASGDLDAAVEDALGSGATSVVANLWRSGIGNLARPHRAASSIDPCRQHTVAPVELAL
jgi:hypothetical protein